MAVVHVVAATEISLRDVSVNAPAESDVDGSAAARIHPGRPFHGIARIPRPR